MAFIYILLIINDSISLLTAALPEYIRVPLQCLAVQLTHMGLRWIRLLHKCADHVGLVQLDIATVEIGVLARGQFSFGWVDQVILDGLHP